MTREGLIDRRARLWRLLSQADLSPHGRVLVRLLALGFLLEVLKVLTRLYA